MMEYLAVLGRQPKISLAELESLFSDVEQVEPELAKLWAETTPDIRRLGGTQKIAMRIEGQVADFLNAQKTGKITLGVSDFSAKASAKTAQREALTLKRILVKAGRSVRVVPNKTATLSSATSFHNHLFGKNKFELIKMEREWYVVVSVQNIEAYVKRDQARPARDAKVGMLPPKLAQILINLCGDLPKGAVLLDPFCGTGVVLQEAALMGYTPYGTDVSERMVEYSERNLAWLYNRVGCDGRHFRESVNLSKSSPAGRDFDPVQPQDTLGKLANPSTRQRQNIVEQGDATSYQWRPPINAVACETYLGRPMSLAPAEIKLKQEKQECGGIVLGFLKNLAKQIATGTPVTIAVPAWLRLDGHYERLNILDEIQNLGYNVKSFKNLRQEDLLYRREGQVVAREIIVLRKK